MRYHVTGGTFFSAGTAAGLSEMKALSVSAVVRPSSGHSVHDARSPLDETVHGTDECARQGASAASLKARVRAEYREMPGLCLTLPQACRLWQLDVHLSASILSALVAEGFLRRTSQGGFRAAED